MVGSPLSFSSQDVATKSDNLSSVLSSQKSPLQKLGFFVFFFFLLVELNVNVTALFTGKMTLHGLRPTVYLKK